MDVSLCSAHSWHVSYKFVTFANSRNSEPEDKCMLFGSRGEAPTKPHVLKGGGFWEVAGSQLILIPALVPMVYSWVCDAG